MPEFEPIIGRFFSVGIDGAEHRVYVEEAGKGIPLLCLHTAGADSRQYRHLLNDTAVTDRFRVIAFDLPYHGRSTPPDGWWLKKYRLTTASYLEMIRAVWLTLGLERPVVMGCSMGGAIALKVAAEYQDELTGIVGLESSAYAPGRYNELLHHPAIHGGELAASYTYGLNSPFSPEASRRENWWYYSQSGPGVYQGDVYFYSMDWDGRDDIKRIDTNRCKVALLTGEYDYSCTPAMSEAVAAAVPGSRLTIMKGMGHFPMVENYPGIPAASVGGARSRGGMSRTSSAALVPPSPCGEDRASDIAAAEASVLRPDRLRKRRRRRIHRDRHAVLPLHDGEVGIDAPAGLVEFHAAAGKVFRRSLARIHCADCLGHLAAVG